jgi:hypothetical protein
MMKPEASKSDMQSNVCLSFQPSTLHPIAVSGTLSMTKSISQTPKQVMHG